jgi:hypothetical protein
VTGSVPLLLEWCNRISATSLSTTIRESDWWFNIIETVHVIFTTLMVGTIFVVDLRLLGIILRNEPASRVVRAVLPWTWTGLAIMASSGLLLFISEAALAYGNIAFRIKLLLLLAAGANAWLFHATIYRSVAQWDTRLPTPQPARTAGALSVALWTAVIISGRAIAYFH